MAHAWRRAEGSKPVVGSSRNSSSGSPMRPRARSRRRCWPPESVFTRLSALASRPTSETTSSYRAGPPVAPGVHADYLADREVAVDACLLDDGHAVLSGKGRNGHPAPRVLTFDGRSVGLQAPRSRDGGDGERGAFCSMCAKWKRRTRVRASDGP